MNRVVTSPPADQFLPDGSRVGGWWHSTGQETQVVCDLCPRKCHLKDGDRGFCFVRENRGGQMLLTTYGRSTGFCIDPIEKKPLTHFYPGSSVLSFGTAGCNLGCKFCQNWDISKSREIERLSERATPQSVAEAARRHGCRSVGNVHDADRQSTYCPGCRRLLIERDWHALGAYHLQGDRCGYCQTRIAGRFDAQPGDWGRRRMPVRISDFAPAPEQRPPSKRDEAMDPRLEPATHVADVPQIPPELSAEQQRSVHLAACEIVAATVAGSAPQLVDGTLAGAGALTVMGAFVTARRQGRLRGCCGWLGQPMPLLQALRNSAARTATDDGRFPPISPGELPYLDIDVTLLAGFEPVRADGRARLDAVEIGKHGLQIRRGDRSGLLLPVVAVEHGMDAEEFLRQVCRKAGLPSNGWEDPDTQLTTFLGLAVQGPFGPEMVRRYPPSGPRFPRAELPALIEHVRQNVLRLLIGATPNYYLTGVSDATVPGVIVSLSLPGHGWRTHLARVQLRPGIPLQATLFQVAEVAAEQLRRAGHTPATRDDLQVGLTILEQPAIHGTVAQADLRGIDVATHLVSVSEGGKTAWVYDPAAEASQLLARAAREARVTTRSAAAVTSFVVHTSEGELCFSNAPRAQAGPEARPSAVAGQFYPADASRLNAMVDEFLAEVEGPAERWPAAMVPHAGLVYSGPIAAAVFKRLKIPDTVIILCPKHTRYGVPWAVAPHACWNLPGWNLKSDTELARRLVEGVPDLELDAAAHQHEHAIEVELPFLARLAPQTKVVGIAIGPGDLERCRAIAAGLAGVLGQMTSPPLLLISSDMNHFATEEENRRLDQIALGAMESLDPARLLETVRRHDISMCGVLPAVIVMETLRQLGKLHRSERVAYGTSADVSGDTSRVVGYAGMLLG